MLAPIPDITEKVHLTKEMVEDYTIHLPITPSKNPDARIGHKSAGSSFFEFKSHLAMTENGLIIGLVITSGEQPDGKYLPELIEHSKQNGMKICTIIGDAAYSGKDNLEKCDQETIQLIAKLNPSVSKGNRQQADNFFLNKDSGMFICPEGHQAIRKAKTGKKSQKTNQSLTYYFDVEKCKTCP